MSIVNNIVGCLFLRCSKLVLVKLVPLSFDPTSPLIEGAMLARLSPAPRLSLVLPLHDSSKTGEKKTRVSVFFSF